MSNFVRKDGRHLLPSKESAVTKEQLAVLLKNMGVIVNMDTLKTTNPRSQTDFRGLDTRLSSVEDTLNDVDLGIFERNDTTVTLRNSGDTVDLDGVLLAGIINEHALGSGVAVEGVVMKDNAISETDYVQFDTSYADGVSEGRLQWNSEDGTLEVGLPGGNVNLQIGQEVLIRVKNETGTPIPNGAAVYINGASGSNPTVALADADSYLTSYVAGVATEEISTLGFITLNGVVHDVNTSAFNVGDELWLSNAAGGLVNEPPPAPDIKVFIGYVLVKHATEGSIIVRPTVIPRFSMLSDVASSGTPDDGDFFAWNTANSRFEIGANVNDYSLTSHTHANATTSSHGFMSSTDKTKLDGIESGAEVNNLSDADATELEGILGLTDMHESGLLYYDDLTDTWELDVSNYSVVGHTHALTDMTGTLDDIADGTNFVRSENNFTDTLLSKLNGIEAGAEVNNISDSDVLLIDELLDIRKGTSSGFLKYSYPAASWLLDDSTYSLSTHNHSLGDLTGDLDDITDGTTYVKSENNLTDALLSKLNGIEAGAEVNNISDTNATDLTDGGDTTLHTHDGRYYTETEVGNTFLKKSSDAALDMNNYHIREAKTVTAYAEYDNGNSGTSKSITLTNGQFQKLTLTGNCTLSFTSMASYPYPTRYQLKLIQDATGNRTVTWNVSGLKWAGGTEPTLSTAAGAIDIITIYFDGTYFYATAGLDFKAAS